MRIFIIHKGSDIQKVELLKTEIYEKTHADILVLNGSLSSAKGDAWKKEAKLKIKISDVIIYALGAESHTSKNIDFEIKVALKHHKQILLLRLNPDQEDIINEVFARFCLGK